MSDFPLKQPTPGRAKAANPHPLAPTWQGPGVQNDEFRGMAKPGDQGTESASSASFTKGKDITARYSIRQKQRQSGHGETPETTNGSSKAKLLPAATPRNY